jgi:hypothetical protein
MACAYAPGSLLFYFASYIARHLVGISVGIGSNRRRKLLYIQMVMAVVEYRPGAPWRVRQYAVAFCGPSDKHRKTNATLRTRLLLSKSASS